jgi:hypothetical protein
VLAALAIDAETGEIDPTAPIVVIAKRPPIEAASTTKRTNFALPR